MPTATEGLANLGERKDVEQPIIDWAHAHGWIHRKLNGQGRRGWPDDLFIGQGPTIVFMEMKAKGKEPRPLQAYVMDLLRYLGCHVTWVDNAEEGITYLGRLYKGPRIMGAAAVSGTVSKNDDGAGSGRRTAKTRKGKDQHNFDSVQYIEDQRSRAQDARYRTTARSVSYLAGRDGQVVPFGKADPHDPPRKR